MNKGLQELKRLAYENACCRCQYYVNKKECSNKDDCVWKIIEKELKALEIIKDFIWMENSEIHLGLYGDVEITLREDDFESKEEYDLLKETLTTEEPK